MDESEADQRVNTAPPSREKLNWVPAVEIRGEGIFIQFDESKIQSWLATAAAQKQERLFFDAHKAWRLAWTYSNPAANFPGIRYVLLHTFSHILMRHIVIACGYSQASVRGSIYARGSKEVGGPMAGILLYTSAPDSEGTLGSLIGLGEPSTLGLHIRSALETAQWCSSDPTCSEHWLDYGTPSLHAAACHACTFAPETSCEKRNRYLDRAVFVSTIGNDTLAYFWGI
jgi:hypothetical protein